MFCLENFSILMFLFRRAKVRLMNSVVKITGMPASKLSQEFALKSVMQSFVSVTDFGLTRSKNLWTRSHTSWVALLSAEWKSEIDLSRFNWSKATTCDKELSQYFIQFETKLLKKQSQNKMIKQIFLAAFARESLFRFGEWFKNEFTSRICNNDSWLQF